MIPRRFKRKKIFVTDEPTKDEAWTDRRDSRNSVVDWNNNSRKIVVSHEMRA